jgi:Fur family peroxide stress response transcriptional regulator
MHTSTEILKKSGLKNTPQRHQVLEAINNINGHPSVEEITTEVKKLNAHIATGTVYKILSTFVEHNILTRIKTENECMRFDKILQNHHHLYSNEGSRIEDYYDDDLDELVHNYFTKKRIKGFKIEEIKLQIIGKFDS